MTSMKPTRPASPRLSSAEASAAKLNKLRGLRDLDIFRPLTDEMLPVLAFLHIHHAADLIVKSVERDLASRGLSLARYAMLRMLSGREPMPLSWLADKHFSRRSNITAVVDRMIRDGLLERFPDAVDRRVIRVGLTAAGEQTVRAARAPHLRFLAEAMAPLQPAELKLLIKLLDKLSAPLDRGSETPDETA
jgi:DNA-binding MarR family transcriptional regulator